MILICFDNVVELCHPPALERALWSYVNAKKLGLWPKEIEANETPISIQKEEAEEVPDKEVKEKTLESKQKETRGQKRKRRN